MRLIILIFTCLQSHFVFSQIESVLLGHDTREAIPFASIYIKNQERGTSSELDGSFSMVIKSRDSLVISSIGYQKLELPYTLITDTIFLKKDIKLMSEVKVSPQNKTVLFPDRNVIGEVKSSFFANNIWYGGGGKPFKIAQYFEYKEAYDNTRFIESITLESLSKINGAKFAINFYTKGNDGMPHMPLNDQFITVETKKRRNKVKIPLLDYNIYIPREGFFLVIKYLNIDANKVLRENPIEFAGQFYKYRYEPFISVIETKSPQFYSFNIKEQKWTLSSSQLRQIESQLILVE